MESVVRVQKAVTMPVYKNDAHNDVEVSWLKKVQSHCPRQADFPSGLLVVIFILTERDQPSHLPTKSLKEQSKTYPSKFDSYFSQG